MFIFELRYKVYMADAQKIWQKLMPEVVTVESHLYRDYT